MTFETIQEHESRALHLYEEDYRRSALVALARSHVVGKRVLDLRCFTGDLAVELAAQGFDVTALDGYPGAVEITNRRARSRGLTRPIANVWDFTDLAARVGDRRFETVLCLDVLNHVRDDRETIAEISRVLVEKGRLILLAPAMPSLHGKRDEALGHLRRYTRSGLRALLERHHLRVCSMRYWNFLALPVYFWFERLLRKGVSDDFRFSRRETQGFPLYRLLWWWYRAVENRLIFPLGLSLFVIARKETGR